MAKTIKQQKEQANEIKEQLHQLTQQQDALQEQIQVERDQGLLDEMALNRQEEEFELELLQVSKKLQKAKAHVKRRKNEIKQWKENFDRLEQLDKSEELKQLQYEISWRSKDIASKENEIASFYKSKTSLSGNLETVNVRKLIVEKGYHKKDISEDPRLMAIIEERNELQATLTELGD